MIKSARKPRGSTITVTSSAPCDFTTIQVMSISMDSGSKSYATNPIDIHIDLVMLTSTRTPSASRSETWGETQAQWQAHKATVQAVVTWLLVHASPWG